MSCTAPSWAMVESWMVIRASRWYYGFAVAIFHACQVEMRFPHLPPQGIRLGVGRRVLNPQTEVRFLDPLPRGYRLTAGRDSFKVEMRVRIPLAVPTPA